MQIKTGVQRLQQKNVLKIRNLLLINSSAALHLAVQTIYEQHQLSRKHCHDVNFCETEHG